MLAHAVPGNPQTEPDQDKPAAAVLPSPLLSLPDSVLSTILVTAALPSPPLTAKSKKQAVDNLSGFRLVCHRFDNIIITEPTSTETIANTEEITMAAAMSSTMAADIQKPAITTASHHSAYVMLAESMYPGHTRQIDHYAAEIKDRLKATITYEQRYPFPVNNQYSLISYNPITNCMQGMCCTGTIAGCLGAAGGVAGSDCYQLGMSIAEITANCNFESLVNMPPLLNTVCSAFTVWPANLVTGLLAAVGCAIGCAIGYRDNDGRGAVAAYRQIHIDQAQLQRQQQHRATLYAQTLFSPIPNTARPENYIDIPGLNPTSKPPRVVI